MADVRMSVIGSPSDVIDPLFSGEVKPEGIELSVTRADGSTGYWRQFTFNEFDVSSLSVASYIIAKTKGYDAIALPVFSSRRFMHAETSYHEDSGIKAPGDLKGKRLGVPEYQMTASVWQRGTLEHDFGVSQYDIHWFMERSEEFSHGGHTGFEAPEDISFTRIPENESLASMIVSNQIDAVSGMGAGSGDATNLIDRSSRIRGAGDWSKVKKLFPDQIEEGSRFWKKYGFIPATQMYTIRRSTYEKYPWAAFNLYDAFLKSKRRAEETLSSRIPALMVFGRDYMAHTRKTFDSDPFAYGVEQNRPMLTTVIDYLYEQKLIDEKPRLEDLFAPSILSL
jgi:4,5-dihydroxyphthalate decarboxylase